MPSKHAHASNEIDGPLNADATLLKCSGIGDGKPNSSNVESKSRESCVRLAIDKRCKLN